MIAERYVRFARTEAAGRSPLYEKLAHHVASSSVCLRFLEQLPPDRQQPNLLFGAVRLVTGTPTSPEALDGALLAHGGAIAAIMLSRTTQTNEPARCAALLPALARIEDPIALIEVGASAGLCLLPEYYGYDWGRQRLDPSMTDDGVFPIFECTASETTPLPTHFPDIVWRAGLDLNPLDVTKSEDMAWLEALVWPEHHLRLERLRAAMRIARKHPPRLVKGDLTRDLDALMAQAPQNAALVIFHTAVLSYIPHQPLRDDFARHMLASGAVWLSNESERVFPQFATGSTAPESGRFLLCRNGKPLAWTGPHGQSIDWIAPD
ncbi:DUF2332 domain-containing protein [uncultured Cohaesibacter sp.]|uniref:DUF2332 domain-containing protein n=1 Tax=uncultured Cohaesibacter sp. TaxID=1002546 RepID=UPI0029C6CCD0|nr:DUF2332 domain-containing protein [uncultured Cohaesibacter sp.]